MVSIQPFGHDLGSPLISATEAELAHHVFPTFTGIIHCPPRRRLHHVPKRTRGASSALAQQCLLFVDLTRDWRKAASHELQR
jgi:hypothetical protein